MAVRNRSAALAIGIASALPVSLFAQDTTGVGGVRGAILEPTGEAAPMVAVCIRSIDRCEVTDASGHFRLTDLRAGRYELEIAPASRPPVTTAIEVRAGRDAIVEVTLPVPSAVVEELRVEAPRFVSAEELKTSAFLVSAAEVLQSAGSLQDVSRYLQTLPGAVLGTDDFRNDLIVRGGSPLENLYIVDNVEIPNINTFANFASAGGTVSVLDADLLQDVTFLTGGYPAAYGNRTSSVLQIALREGSRSRTSGRVTFGFAGVGAVVEGPIAHGRGSWVVSTRRSVLDLVTHDVGIGGVPVLYTFNGKLTYDITARDRLWLLNITGVDHIRLGLSPDSDLSDEISNLDIRYRGGRSATGLNWQRTFGARGVGLLGVTYARAWVRSSVADLLRDGVPAPETSVDAQLAAGETVFRERSTEGELAIKYDFTAAVRAIGKVQGGASVKRTAFDYDTASPFGTDSPYFRGSDENAFSLRKRGAAVLAASYLQTSRPLGPRLDVTAGVRLEHFALLSATRVSPRAALSVAVTPRVSWRVSAGGYFQQPLAIFVKAFPENATLTPFRADHAVSGLQWTPTSGIRLTAEAYYKRYRQYPVSSQVPSLSLANIGDTFAVRDVLFPLVSRGIGDASGVELFFERRSTATGRWYGQGNLALSRARYAGTDGVRRPGAFDYPVVANLVGGWHVDDHWDLATRASFLSGRPFTPLDAVASASARRAIYDTTHVNSERLNAYFRLDVRADRRFTVNGRPLRVFAGLQNLTDRRNLAGYTWDRRNNRLKTLTQLGLFPILGLDWQL